MESPISVAIETSSRQGSVALGAGEELLDYLEFAADQRHAVQVVARLEELLAQGPAPGQVEEIYVSAGPGSFTGLRVGVTVARTLAQAVPGIRCVAVPTAAAIARNAADLPFEHLAVVMDAKEDSVYVAIFTRQAGQIIPEAHGRLMSVAEALADLPKPIITIGEALGYCNISGDGITPGPFELYPPNARGVWTIGRQLSKNKAFTEINALLPIYSRRPEAVRLWENRAGNK